MIIMQLKFIILYYFDNYFVLINEEIEAWRYFSVFYLFLFEYLIKVKDSEYVFGMF